MLFLLLIAKKKYGEKETKNIHYVKKYNRAKVIREKLYVLKEK